MMLNHKEKGKRAALSCRIHSRTAMVRKTVGLSHKRKR